jgi:hypothetical protein
MLRLARTVFTVLRITGVILLALFLALCLWIEVIAGTGNAWDYVQPGYSNPGAVSAWMAFAVLGPAVVVVTVIRTRRRPYGIANRALHIEKWGLLVAIPLALLAFASIIAQSGVI